MRHGNFDGVVEPEAKINAVVERVIEPKVLVETVPASTVIIPTIKTAPAVIDTVKPGGAAAVPAPVAPSFSIGQAIVNHPVITIAVLSGLYKLWIMSR